MNSLTLTVSQAGYDPGFSACSYLINGVSLNLYRNCLFNSYLACHIIFLQMVLWLALMEFLHYR